MRCATLVVGTFMVLTAAQGQEQRMGLRLILVDTEAQASNVLARLTKGESFEALAREVSRHPSAPNGGFIGLLDRDHLRSEFQSALASVSPGHISGIVKLNTGFALLYRWTADETRRFAQLEETEELARKRGFATALHEAVINADTPNVERLLAAKVDIRSTDTHGWSAFQRAAQRGQAQIARLLLEHGADVEERGPEGFTPIIRSAESGSADTVAVMIHYQANVNARTDDGRTALYQAADLGSVAVAKLLLANGAHADSRDRHGTSAMAVATLRGHVELIDLLARRGADVNAADSIGRTPLHLAAAAGNSAATRLLLSRGAAINSRNGAGCTPLNIAAEGSAEVVRTLIAAGADVNVACAHNNLTVAGITALHAAVNNGNRIIVQLLLDAKAFVDAKDSLAQQPLILAVYRGDWEIGDLLIKHGADVQFDVSLMNPEGVGLFRPAADRGYPFAQFALAAAYQFGAAGLSTDMAAARGWYMKAATQGHPGASNGLGWMYQYGLGGDGDIREAARWFRVAAEKGYATAQNNLGFVLLHYAEVRNYPEAVEWLRKAAAQQHGDALQNLGTAYERGLGVRQDYETAASLYRRAAERGGLPAAAASLAKLHLTGRGVKLDDAEAYAWLLLAIQSAKTVHRNPEVDETNQMRADMEALTKRLSRAQISAAEQWVEQWSRTHLRK